MNKKNLKKLLMIIAKESMDLKDLEIGAQKFNI
jgi:hypothetical protein